MSEEFLTGEPEVELLFEQSVEIEESSQEPPIEEWSSYLCFLRGSNQNFKHRLFQAGLFEPPVEEICAKYIPVSDSSVYRHPYYNYPAVKDPGNEDALLQPAPVIVYKDDGQDLYKALCKEMNEPYSRIFHKQLLESHMNMSYYGISTYGWRPIAMVLKKNRIVRSIDFTSNFISIDGCYHIGDMLRDNFTITELNFSGCRMGPDGMKNLVANFKKNKTLRKLDVSKNCLADAGMAYLTKAIYMGSSVSDLRLSYNGLTSLSALNLAEAIEFVNQITHLDLSFNSFTVPRPVETLISRFLDSQIFVEMDLSWNSLNNRFVKALSNLILCPNIQIVKLSNNSLTGDCIKQIAENLKHAKNLQILDMSFNPLTIPEAKLLLNPMRLRQVKLKKLLMDNVNVDEAFVILKNSILDFNFRKKAVITHGCVVPKIVGTYPDIREIVLNRAEYLCRTGPKKERVNIGQLLLQLNKDNNGEPMLSVALLRRKLQDIGALQLNKDFVDELAAAFPGPKVGKERPANVDAMADFVRRKWPDTTLPPIPKDAGKVGNDTGKKVKEKDPFKGKKVNK